MLVKKNYSMISKAASRFNEISAVQMLFLAFHSQKEPHRLGQSVLCKDLQN